MKRLLLISLLSVLLFSFHSSNAQPYQSIFGDSVSAWTCWYSGLAIGSMNTVTSNDTIVKGEHHKILLWDYNVFPTSPGKKLGLLKEDTTTGKVWYRSLPNPANGNSYLNPARDTQDILIMDMSLQLGDTFVAGKVNGLSDTIAIVDSVYIDANNRKHIRFNIRISWAFYFEFIEGVGTTLGIAYKDSNTIYHGAQNGGLICAFHNRIDIYSTAYKAQLNNKCLPDVSVGQLNKQAALTIHPNPSTGSVTIELPTRQQTNVSIADISGRTVYQNTISNKQTLQVDLSKQPKGVYIIHLTTNDKHYTNKLLLE